MSGSDELAGFERQLRELLERNAQAASGRVRSRLTQARHAALAQAGRRGTWRVSLPARRLWLPAAGTLAAAAVLVMAVGSRHAAAPPFAAGTGVVTAQDMTLLTDRDGLALVEDGNGQFYEWAAAQARSAPATAPENDEPDKHGG